MTYSRSQSELIGLFRYKTEQLGKAIKSGGIFDAIEAAGLIRDILLSDTNGIFGTLLKDIPELKNKHSRKIRFEVVFLGSTYHSHLDEFPVIANAPSKTMICPHKEFNGNQRFNRHDFLALPILCTEAGHYSYKDVISFAANKLGSRHFDHDGGTDEQMILHEIRDKFSIEGFNPVVSPILGLGSVVHTTCKKLLERIDSIASKS